MTVMSEHEHAGEVQDPAYPIKAMDYGTDIIPLFGTQYHGQGNMLHVHDGEVEVLTGDIDDIEYVIVEPEGELQLVGPLRMNNVRTITGKPGSLITGYDLHDSFISFAGTFDSWDVYQYGIGLITGGLVQLYGRRQAPRSAECLYGLSVGTLRVSCLPIPEGWQIGDRVAVEGTEQKVAIRDLLARWNRTTEMRTVRDIGPDWIEFDTPLAFNHPANGEYTPQIHNISRSFYFRGDPAGVRPHIMAIHSGSLDFQNIGHYCVGREHFGVLGGPHGWKKLSRYANHLHHAGASPSLPDGTCRSRFIGNSYEQTGEWGIVCHDSHFVDVIGNVGVLGTGAGIVTENIEYGCRIENNIWGGLVSRSKESHGFITTPDGRIFHQLAQNGSPFWFRCTGNIVRGNRGFDYTGGGPYYDGYYHSLLKRYPTALGQDPALWEAKKIMPYLYHGQNFFIGGKIGDWRSWDHGMGQREGSYPIDDLDGDTYVNCANNGAIAYHTGGKHYNGYKFIADRAVSLKNNGKDPRWSVGGNFGGNSYQNNRLQMKDCVFMGFNCGIDLPNKVDSEEHGPVRFINCVITQNVQTNVRLGTHLGPLDIEMIDCVFGPEAQYDVTLNFTWNRGDPFAPMRLVINGKRYYFQEQAPDFVLPQAPIVPAALVGKTNQQLVEMGLPPIGGKLAPELTTDPRVLGGFVCDE